MSVLELQGRIKNMIGLSCNSWIELYWELFFCGAIKDPRDFLCISEAQKHTYEVGYVKHTRSMCRKEAEGKTGKTYIVK